MNKKIIVFFSYTNHTRIVANKIKNELNCDVLEIEPLVPYSNDYNEVVRIEKNNTNDIQIKKIDIDLSKYDEIILGFPVWWYVPATPIRTFLKLNDLRGKIIKPFATNAGWLGESFEIIKKLCPNAKIDNGMNIVYSEDYKENKLITDINEIDEWIKAL